MKFFKKYYLVLPPVALIYGIYAMNINWPKDDFPETMMDSLVNGWSLIWILFSVLAAGIVYQLQQNKNQQYIYSFPWNKKEIYRKSLTGLHISALIAEIIYGVFFAVKLLNIPDTDTFKNVIACTLINAAFCIALCGITQLALIVTSYIWQGLVIAGISIYGIIPMIIRNIAFLFHIGCRLKGNTATIIQEIIYTQTNKYLYPFNFVVNPGIAEENMESAWKAEYTTIALLCIVLFFITACICFWLSKRRYTRQDLAQNATFSRMTEVQNKIVMTIFTGSIIFDLVSNHEIFLAMTAEDPTYRRSILSLLIWNKAVISSETHLKVLLQRTDIIHLLIYLVVIFAFCYLVISLIQTIRRKHYERDH